MAKQKGLSPTFKIGLIVIVVFGLIWAYTTYSEPWYQEPEVVEEPIKMVDETPADDLIEEEPVVEEEAVEEEPEVVEEPVEEETNEPTMAELLNDSFDYNKDPMTIPAEDYYWSFKRNAEHTPVVGYSNGIKLENYDAYFRTTTEDKVVYLTFDEGYENGFTPQILDTLSKTGVQAAFFVTEGYIKQEPDLVKRMKDEGHIVGNHSVNHYDGSTGDGTSFALISVEEMQSELQGVEVTMEELTGYKPDLFFRPPGGRFNERSLYVTRQLGYKTIFWSMAYQDWYVDNQPGKDVAYDHVLTNYHPGAIILLHAVSESNTQALEDIINALKAEGYRFGSLYELESNF